MFEDRQAELQLLAKEQGLDFFPVNFEIVPFEVMTEVAAYGLPTRAHHWSYGKVYNAQRLYGEMGLSKIYEIVLNNDPGLAFLLDSNPEIANLLVSAHVYAHVDFFKNNVSFADTNRNMVNDAAHHAIRIDQYTERYGQDVVEHLMDIGFALDRHIDWHKGIYRPLYPPRTIVEKERTPLPYEDLFGNAQPSITYVVEGERFPPHPERDLLWFLVNYAKIEEWQKDVLNIIRDESYYFYPQFITKILNEGWASYWHAELFHQWDGVKPDEMLEFARLHAGVVNPGARFSINPYYLGYKIFVDIEKRWDKKHEEWRKKKVKGEKTEGSLPPTGREKIFEVRALEDDLSFIRNYLTIDLIRDLELFAYGERTQSNISKPAPSGTDIIITSREQEAIIEALIAPRYNYGIPHITVQDVVNNILYLEHIGRDISYLDREFANTTMAYIAELWKHPVHLLTKDEQGRDVTLTK